MSEEEVAGSLWDRPDRFLEGAPLGWHQRSELRTLDCPGSKLPPWRTTT
jgi:hypothetical protein